MISVVTVFLAAISVSNACVPTTTTTTTTPCCQMLSTASLPRRNPSVTTYQQCSVLHRVSSTCPIDGIIVCDAAQETNPTNVIIQLFNGVNVVRTLNVPGTSAKLQVYCTNGVWQVRTNPAVATSLVDITSVSCSQIGSTGTDLGYITGSASS